MKKPVFAFIFFFIIFFLIYSKTFAINGNFNASPGFIFAIYNPFKDSAKKVSPSPKFSYSFSRPIVSAHIPKPTIVFKNTPIPTQSNPTPNNSAPIQNNSPLDFIMNAINNYRKSSGLPSVSTDLYTCNFANTRAQEISSNFNHDGFTNRMNSKTLPYPSYSYVTENLAMSSDYKNAVNMWINSSVHVANLRADTPYACVGINGNYYAYESWKP